VAAAIAASNGVLVPVGGMALSVASLRGGAMKCTRIAFEGCALLSLDVDSDSIMVVFTILMVGGCNNQIGDLIVEYYPVKLLVITATT